MDKANTALTRENSDVMVAYKNEVTRLVVLMLGKLKTANERERVVALATLDFIKATGDVQDSDYCNALDKCRATIYCAKFFDAADQMFPLPTEDNGSGGKRGVPYYDNASILITDMAFHMLLEEVWDGVIDVLHSKSWSGEVGLVPR